LPLCAGHAALNFCIEVTEHLVLIAKAGEHRFVEAFKLCPRGDVFRNRQMVRGQGSRARAQETGARRP
jgi:hypothetical protein